MVRATPNRAKASITKGLAGGILNKGISLNQEADERVNDDKEIEELAKQEE